MAATGKRNRLAVWLWVAVAVGIGVLYFVPLSLFPKCPLRELTGWNCPGCGATRAAHELVHGHIRAALHLNALFVLAIPGLVLTWLWSRRTMAAWSSKPVVWWLLLGVVLVFGIGRNIPVVPFTWLAP